MNLCKYMVLDEGDRMLDLGFDEEVHGIINKYILLFYTIHCYSVYLI